ncbi:MAG TPA: hypothetical protein PLH23_05005 [Hyphomonadaceae bacterium]|nr:hypothetical protein [Hyphomonadaceae bacterium]
MTGEMDSDEGEPDKPWWWFVFWILAPLGVLGGPLAIADLFAGVIEWHGWVGYLVSFWDENVSQPFGAVFGAIADFLHVPRFTEEFVDYIALGTLCITGMLRPFLLLEPKLITTKDWTLGGALWRFVGFCIVVLIWPVPVALFLMMTGRELVEGLEAGLDGHLAGMVAAVAMAFGPFALFLALWAANTWAAPLPG